LATHGVACSMSRRGNCYDNAVMEAFFSAIKSELGEWFDSHGDAKAELCDDIEVFYTNGVSTPPHAFLLKAFDLPLELHAW
jgi:transposase InsO family protein